MIGRILRLLRACFVYACVATVLAQLLLVGVFLWRYGFSRQRAYETLAVIYQIDLDAIAQQQNGLPVEPSSEQVAFDEVVEARLQANLDIEVRQQSLDMALRDLRTLQSDVLTRQSRLDQLSKNFDQQLSDAQELVEQQAILELEQTLQAIQPRQAKEQLILMLDDEELPPEDSMLVVVSILKSMPLDKRKRILAEFKSDEEAERLAEILRQIRLGEPEISVIRQTRSQVQQAEPRVAESQG